jgi:ubiquinone/menaquinone biosynthesis C-methylase UbiE
MGIYRKYIFPHLLEFGMSRKILEKDRREILAEVNGEILEIGFGTGTNLPFYPEHVKRITVVESNEGMHSKARERIQSSGIEVDLQFLDADSLPFHDNMFDSVVSTYTLCSIENVKKAMAQIVRVLKQGGRLFFLEHGLSPDQGIHKWQDRLNSINKALADGCNLNRNIKQLIESAPLQIAKLENFYLEKIPKIGGYMYKGNATKIQ